MKQHSLILIEDEAELREILGERLKAHHFNVFAFNSVEDAYDFLFDQPETAIVISDVQLPGKSGLDLLKEVRAKCLDAPYFIMSGGSTTAEDVIRHGGTAFFAKPFNADDLIQEVSAALKLLR